MPTFLLLRQTDARFLDETALKLNNLKHVSHRIPKGKGCDCSNDVTCEPPSDGMLDSGLLGIWYSWRNPHTHHTCPLSWNGSGGVVQ